MAYLNGKEIFFSTTVLGESGGAQTAKVTIEASDSGYDCDLTLYYVDGNGEFQERAINTAAANEITMMIPSLLMVKDFSRSQFDRSDETDTGGVVWGGGGFPFISFTNSNGEACYFVTGDGSLLLNSCFAYGTAITLADGTTKEVQNITYQDKLLVWDFDNGCISSAKPIWIKKAQTADYYYLCKFANGAELKLIGSGGKCHRILDLEKGCFESATDCVGKRVMTAQGETVLTSCERINEAVDFYNIITEKHINLYAEGVLASCRLNNIYPIEGMRFVKDGREARENGGIDSKLWDGLRLAEQTMSDSDIKAYVNNLTILAY